MMKNKINFNNIATSLQPANQQAVTTTISLPSYTELLHQDIHALIKSLKKQAMKISDRIARKRFAKMIKHYQGMYKIVNNH